MMMMMMMIMMMMMMMMRLQSSEPLIMRFQELSESRKMSFEELSRPKPQFDSPTLTHSFFNVRRNDLSP